MLWGGQWRGPEQAQAWEVEGGTEGAGALPHSGIPTLGLGCFPPRPPVLFPLLQQRGKGGCNLGEWGSPCPPHTPWSQQQRWSSLPGRRQLPRWHLGPAVISRRCPVLAGVALEPQSAQPGALGQPHSVPSLQDAVCAC